MSEARDNDGRREVEAVFAAFVRERGFQLRGSRAWRRREGVQDGLILSRSRTGLEQSIGLYLRIDRPGDRGGEVLRAHDIQASLGSLFFEGHLLESKEDLALYKAVTRLGPPPSGGRGLAIQRLLGGALTWFEEIGSEAAIRRCTGEEYCAEMGLVTRDFFEDFVWKTP